MRAYYYFYSFFYFVRQVFLKKHYQIIFYTPSHFNRGEDQENLFLKDFLDLCKKESISFLYLEEPDIYSNQRRSRTAIPFDVIYYLVIFLRKIIREEISFVEKDKKIGRFIKKIFFRNITFDNYITISQSMLSLFNGINPTSKQFDLQHGTIHAEKEDYLAQGLVSDNLKKNDAYLLISGDSYKDILVRDDLENYFHDHIKVVGSSLIDDGHVVLPEINKNVLVSLQFTHDHSDVENKEVADALEEYMKKESDFYFYLRDHPRSNNEVDLSQFSSLPNVSLFSGSLEDSIEKCSLHLTAYSTVAFEVGLHGVPSCFLQLVSSKMRIFKTQYAYPFYQYSLSEMYDNYSFCSSYTKKWAKGFYQPFCKESFLKALK